MIGTYQNHNLRLSEVSARIATVSLRGEKLRLPARDVYV